MNIKKPVSDKKYPVLETEIFSRGIKKKAIADRLNITTKALSNKLSGKSAFSWDEVVKLKCVFFPDVDTEKLMNTADEINERTGGIKNERF